MLMSPEVLILTSIDISENHLSSTWDIADQGFDCILYKLVTPYISWEVDTIFFEALEERVDWALLM
jgi:hypothetical protein